MNSQKINFSNGREMNGRTLKKMTEEDAKLFEKNHLAKTEDRKPFKATKP